MGCGVWACCEEPVISMHTESALVSAELSQEDGLLPFTSFCAPLLDWQEGQPSQ